MTDGDAPVWRRDEPESPCIKLCVVDRSAGYCIGCGRSPEEIQAWPSLGASGRRAILERLPARLEALKPRRGRGPKRRRDREDGGP